MFLSLLFSLILCFHIPLTQDMFRECIGPVEEARKDPLFAWMKSTFKCFQFSSVSQSCPTLCDPMDYSTPGFPGITNSQSLLKLMSIELVMPSKISSSVIPFSSSLLSFPLSGSFPMSHFFVLGGQSIAVSASA